MRELNPHWLRPGLRRCALWLALALAILGLPAYAADPVLEWTATIEEAMAKVSGLRSERAQAIAWLAAFNALNTIDPRYQSYAPAPEPTAALSGVKPSAAAALAAALYTALVVEGDADQALLARKYRETLDTVKVEGERARGVRLGHRAAVLLLAQRSGDWLGRVEPIVEAAAPGVFVSSPEAGMPRSVAMAGLAPFGVRSVMAFDPGPPPSAAVARRDTAQARGLGAATSTVRSADQTAAALFWVGIEPADFIALQRPALEARKLDSLELARIAALDAMIGIDSSIVVAALKERYRHWRPEMAIAGALAEERDAAWQPLLPAPNNPEYPSTGAAAAGALEVELPRLYGLTGAIEMRLGRTQQRRRWAGAAEMADELAWSRVWAGAHFAAAVEAGRGIGRAIASEVVERQLSAR